MAVTFTLISTSPMRFQGLSTDTKPTTYAAPGDAAKAVPAESIFSETDTGKKFEFDGSAWFQAQAKTGGADHVLADLGTGFGIAQNHEDTGILTSTTRRRMTLGANGPTRGVLKLKGATGDEMYVVINAISTQHADNELADPPSRDAVTARYTLREIGVEPAGIELADIDGITHIDYRMASAGVTPVLTWDAA